MPEPTPWQSTLDLDAIVVLLHEQHHLTDAYVEQTGGGVAAIVAGPKHLDDGVERWAVMAGPGSYGWGVRKSTADLAEFYIGPDDQGEADPVEPVMVGAHTESAVAELIAAQARKGATSWACSCGETTDNPGQAGATPGKPCPVGGYHAWRRTAPASLTFDEITELGYDGTGRSLPPPLATAREEARVRTEAHNATNRRLIAEGVTRWEDRAATCEAAGEAAVEKFRRTR